MRPNAPKRIVECHFAGDFFGTKQFLSTVNQIKRIQY